MGAEGSKGALGLDFCAPKPTDGKPGCPDLRQGPDVGSAGMNPPTGSPSFEEAWAPFLDPTTNGNIWPTYKIVSGPDIKKIPAPVNLIPFKKPEIWGKYKKIYSKSPIGIDQGFFNPPLNFYIDDAYVICACKDIETRFYGNNSEESDIALRFKILTGVIPKPACWDDYQSIFNPQGDKTFDVHVNHPGFTFEAISSEGSVGIAKNIAGVAAQNPLLSGLAAWHFLSKKGGRRKRTIRKKIKKRTKRLR